MTRAAWLREAPVTSATTMAPPPATALHVAFTTAGLEALGLPASVRAAFSPEFLTGADDESRDGALPRRVSGLPRVVTVRGGACSLAPGPSPLRYLVGV